MQAGLQDHRTYMVPSVQRQRRLAQARAQSNHNHSLRVPFMHKKYHLPLGSLRMPQIFRRGLGAFCA
jgi:hypothetical protein